MTDSGDYGALLNPKRQLSLRAQHAIDRLSWALPAVAALLSAGSGITALWNENACAAWLGIGGGIAAAADEFDRITVTASGKASAAFTFKGE